MKEIIKQDGKTYRQDWTGKWVADKDCTGYDKIERDSLNNPKIERDSLGYQKVERGWDGKPIISPEVEANPCFIATAAYGTSFANEIKVLREWRDDLLEDSSLGRLVVEFYYKISPPIARYIQQRDCLRSSTRYLLSPLINHLKTKYPK